MDIFFYIALFATSIIAVTYIVERGLALRWKKVIPRPVEEAVEKYRSNEDLPQLRRTCDYYPSTISRLILFATEHLDWAKSEAVDVLETRARHEVSKLDRGLVVLEIIVGIAPLLGLVGTIYGLIVLFASMSNAAITDNAEFARGISVALNATLMGLLIAIPALVAWSYYSKKVENLAVEMETLCDEFLRKHYRTAEPPIPHQPPAAVPTPFTVAPPPLVSEQSPVPAPVPATQSSVAVTSAPVTAQRPARKPH